MELKWLEDFVTLARLGNFSASADLRNVTQPAFSRRIQALEYWLSTELFDRSKSPIQLTEQGEMFLPRATQLVSKIYNIRKEFADLTSRRDRTLRITTLHTLANEFVPYLITSTDAHRLPITFQVTPDVKGIENHVVQLLKDDADILITYETPGTAIGEIEGSALDKKILGHEKLIPIIHKNLVKRFCAISDSIQDWQIPYLSYARYSFSYGCLQGLIRNIDWTLLPAYESSLGESLVRMAGLEAGLAWVPSRLAAQHPNATDFVKLGGDDMTVGIDVVAYGRQDNFNEAEREFWLRMDAVAPFQFFDPNVFSGREFG